ncbi:MAG TPA: tol-pal system protein YbgF [Xanthobacteraceae bacterium]|nr:tol-pal system protein YbgF [Xanthobacteraceae bacterium]
MTLVPTRTAFAATLALALSSLVCDSGAFAQYDQRHGPSPGGAPVRYEVQQDDGLFGGLFGRNERAQRTQPVQASAPDLIVRLERLENHIRQLTGAIEQLQHRNHQLEQQLQRQQEDAEYRFQELGGKAAPSRRPQPAAQSSPVPASAAVPGRRSDVFDPADNPNAPGAPQTLGSIPTRSATASPILDDEPQIGAPGGRPAGAPLDLGTLADRAVNDPRIAPDPAPSQPADGRELRTIPGVLPPPPARNPSATGARQQLAAAPSAAPRDEFALAQGYIQRRDYALAEESLREFLQKHPSDRLVPDAHYWLGESLYQRQRYRDAAESFLAVSTKYEKSGKAPDSLLRLGQSLAALGEREAACATLGEVMRKYPKASAGVKQSVEREQKRVRC